MFDTYKENWAKLEAAAEAAAAAGTLVGRYIQHPYADSYATYRITKVTKTRATIEVVTGIGDDWVLPAWGQKTSIPLSLAKSFVDTADAYRKLFSKGAK